MVENIKQIGTVVSDTGKLIICDPDYITDWKDDKFESKKAFIDTQTEKVYTYGIDFNKFTDVLFDDKTVNQLIEEERLERIPYPETNEFAKSAVNAGVINKGFAQCNFNNGTPGQAIAIGTSVGDGEFPVFAEYTEGRISKIWIDFLVEEE